MAKDDQQPPVKIDLGVGAKLEVKAEIPSSSVGRFVEAFTDVFPMTIHMSGLFTSLTDLEICTLALCATPNPSSTQMVFSIQRTQRHQHGSA
jgi:hypothetical protein